MAPPRSAAAERRPAPRWWRRALPFVVAVALVAFVVARLDHRAFLSALERLNGAAYLGAATIFILALLAADSFATVLVYRRAVAPIAYREFLALRGASYLPALLNHHVGQAFVTVFLSRVHRIPVARVAGATLLVYASWLGALLLLAAIALPLRGTSPAWSALALAPGVLYLAIIAARPAPLARTRLLAPLFEAGVNGHLAALAARLPHVVVLFFGTWIPFSFFGVHIPPADALALIPILMVVVTLPITPQGIGARDVVAVAFFERFAQGATHEERLAAIAASTTTWAVAITLVEAALGLALLRSVTRKLHASLSMDEPVA